MNHRKVSIKVIAIITIAILAIIGGYIYIQIGPYDRQSKKEVVVEIPSGATLTNVTDILKDNKLIKNKALFKVVAKISPEKSGVKAGKYLLKQNYSNSKILDILTSGKFHNDGIKVTIPEGLTYKEVIKYLTDKGIGKKEVYEQLINNPKEFYDKFKFLNKPDIKSLEGFLYPDTYYFNKTDNEKEVLSDMLERFNKIYTNKFKEEQKARGLTLQQVVNLASIIEKEAVLDEDRPMIASVFYNRLKIGMPLQSDATIQYIFEERKERVMYKDLKIDSPYNSYINKGLPPTPIANPGVKSIEAVLNPSQSDYLYFVATVDGKNNYSKTYDEHLKYVENYKQERDKLNQEKSKK
ncbi:endolytic transglycosylase MltG [Paraclostridium sordellii]|uniref:Endolytic murein transglycosylase n=1 Tax=Paraclostridium sordellii TaxID=1505 RepID=A0A9P1L674_PARSO|nr:endolytic transglycosylase MltG [Paeniclostridium sordellii]CEO34316.1 aminodeoxychorismate lyase [[Clostridium] sordellii] [Paeniclostridium sordellii]